MTARTLLLTACLLLSGCSESDEPPAQDDAATEKAEEDRPNPTEKAKAHPSEPAAAKKREYQPPTELPADAPAGLIDPSQATETAPDSYRVQFETTAGEFTVQVHRDWAPRGADRFYNLVRNDFYDGVAFFRAIDNFMVQFGLSGMPEVNAAWRDARIPDDEVTQQNTRGRITFATSGPNSRTTQVFINYTDRNTKLDNMGFAPFGEVVEGMKTVDSLYKGYGEGAPRGAGPSQGRIQAEGNSYLVSSFPRLDFVIDASIIEP